MSLTMCPAHCVGLASPVYSELYGVWNENMLQWKQPLGEGNDLASRLVSEILFIFPLNPESSEAAPGCLRMSEHSETEPK